MKKIYELITPSDEITFEAYDDKVAYACAVLLSNGMAGLKRHEDNESVEIPALIGFSKDPESKMQEYLGTKFSTFLEQHKPEMAEAYLSFAYTTVSGRKLYNDAVAAITDPEKLKEFKTKCEDRERTSMSQWVKSAWKFGEQLNK